MPYDPYGNWYPPMAQPGPWMGYPGMYTPPPTWTHQHMAEFWPDYHYYDWEPSDADITDMVMDNIDTDPMIPRSDRDKIQVETRDAIVRIFGTVSSKQAKHAAHSDAFWTYGVVDVIDELEVVERPTRPEAQPAQRQPARPGMRAGQPAGAGGEYAGRRTGGRTRQTQQTEQEEEEQPQPRQRRRQTQ